MLRQAIDASLRLQRVDAAVEMADRLLEQEKKVLAAESPEWVGDLRGTGAAYLAQGELEKAKAALERALEITKKSPVYPGWVGELKLRLAQTVVKADRARAQTLVREAITELEANAAARRAARRGEGVREGPGHRPVTFTGPRA